MTMTLGTVAARRLSLQEMVAQATLVEGLGYDCLWIPEIAERDAVVTAAVLAERTDIIGMATGIVPLPLRSPTLLAMAAAAASESTAGRFVLGVGLGHKETAARWYGTSGPSRIAEAEEQLRVLREILERGRVNHLGDHLAVEFGLQARHFESPPRIVLAALSPRVTELATTVADGILCNWVPPGRIETLASIVARRCADLGRARGDFAIATYVPVCVTEDVAAAQKSLGKQLRAYSRLTSYRRVLEECGLGREIDQLQETGDVSPRLAYELAAIGPLDAVQDKLRSFEDAGVDHAIIVPIPLPGDPWQSMVATWAALAPGTGKHERTSWW